MYENSGCQSIVIPTATSLGSRLYKKCGFKPNHQCILEHMCSSATNKKKHFSMRPYKQEACVHIVVSSRKCTSALFALVPANLFVKNIVAPSTCEQSPSKKLRCNEVFNSSTSAASIVAAPMDVLRPHLQTGDFTASTMAAQEDPYDVIVLTTRHHSPR